MAFELDGALAELLPELALGPWTRAPRIAAFAAGNAPSSSRGFGDDAAADATASLWRVTLDGDAVASAAALDRGERSLRDAMIALDRAPHRFAAAVARACELAAATRHEDHAFDASTGAASRLRGSARHTREPRQPDALPEIEQALVHALVAADQPPANDAHAGSRSVPTMHELPGEPPRSPANRARAGSRAGPTVHDLPGFSPPGADALERSLQRAVDAVRGRARIETRVGGVLVAYSVTALAGDTALYVTRGLSVAGARLHGRSVALAIQTCAAWTRIIALLVGCATRLATLGLPAGALSALPLVLRFVRDLLAEPRALHGAT